MKNLIFSLVALVALMVSSCKSNDPDPNTGLSAEIQKIVPQNILDDVKAKGMAINEGRVPPKLEGIYRINPLELLSPFSEKDPWKKGTTIGAYQYKFSGQSTDNKTVLMDYTNGSDKGSGLGSFVAGNGKKFTIFAEVKGVAVGVNYTMLKIISGEMTDSGEIKDYQESLYLKDKDESDKTTGYLIPINTGRIWFDNDRLSERISIYSGRVAQTTESAKIRSVVSTDK
jgi:hypothetical protein